MPALTPRPIRALFKRELGAYFANPTAYIFITLFVFLSGVTAFWVDAFFLRNLANLDQLNRFFPILLLFLIPAITMAAWAEERKQGTDEILLTMPATEGQLALGKYLGCLAIYAICLVFAASHIVVLAYLGRPDVGLLLATYLGYFLAGAGLLAIGLFASSLSASGTIAYIAGACACALLVGIALTEHVLPAPFGSFLRTFSVPARLESFGRGVIDPADILYFLALAALGIWLTSMTLRRRRTVGLPRAGAALHLNLRALSIAAIAVCAVILVQRTGARADATAERLWSLTPASRDVVAHIPAENPVTIVAYVSPQMPASLVQQRDQLNGMLRELEAIGRGRIITRIIDTEPNTQQARDADRSYSIKPRPVPADTGSMGATQDTFLAFVATSATGEVSTVPFLPPGLPVEYELARSIRSVTGGSKKTIGILETPAGLFGSFDFQTMSSRPDWPIVSELRKQYNVQRVSPEADYPKDIDVLFVAQPSSLTDEGLKRVIDWLNAGKPTLICEDPMPLINPGLATIEPRQQNPMMRGQDPAPKPNLQPLWDALGAKISGDFVAWDSFNPRPTLAETPQEFLWIKPRPEIGFKPFADHPLTSGLQEVVMLFTGRIEKLEPKAAAPGASAPTPPEFKSLIISSPTSGIVSYANIMTRNMFGQPSLNPARRPSRVGQSQTLVAQVTGGEKKLNALLIADLDMISDTFFSIRESGNVDLEFDNVPLILNAVDHLTGDQALLDLRKKRRTYRTLTKIDERRVAETEETLKAEDAAKASAESRLTEARARLDAKIKEIEERKDLDTNSKTILLESVRQAEQTRLNAQSAAIEEDQKRDILDARLKANANIDSIKSSVRIAAVTLPPVPALLTGLIVMAKRRRAQSA